MSERAGFVAAAVVEKLVEAAEPGAPAGARDLALLLGELEGWLTMRYPAPAPLEAADYAREALDEIFDATDRLRCHAVVLPAHALEPVTDLRPPVGSTHPLRVAEAAARLGGSPLDEHSLDSLEGELLRLLERPGAVARAHDDPEPIRRIARRTLQRLDGSGKWGGYHTEFVHLARGFEGNERALALEVGEALLAAGLLGEKRSVGQRHVFLNPRRSGEIRRLIDQGAVPASLVLPVP